MFLALLAAALHLYELAGIYPYVFAACAGGMTLLYPFYIVELAWHFCAGSSRWRQHLLYCLVPPLRLGARDSDQGQSVWLPWLGRQEVTPQLITRLDRQISLPMIVIALMVLPWPVENVGLREFRVLPVFLSPGNAGFKCFASPINNRSLPTSL